MSQSDDPLATARPGGAAYQMYLDMVNVGRKVPTMNAVSPQKTIDQSTPTRYAVVQVLTTGTILCAGQIIPLLAGFNYFTNTKKLRSSLNRLNLRGLVEKTKRWERKHGASGWRLTALGSTYALAACGHHATNGKGITHLAKGSGGTTKRSKGSAGRTSSMCIDPNKPTFTKAVTEVVAELVAKQASFSAYDVTKALREKVNTGTFTIDPQETGTVFVGGKGVPKIEHEAVKGVVTECFHANEMPGYDRDHNGSYFEYKPVAAAPDPAAPPTPPPITGGGSYDGTPTL